MGKKKYPIIFIMGFTLFLTFLHHFLFQAQSPHIILEELYYIPLLLGALLFGLKGAIYTYLFVSALYFPYIFGHWTTTFLAFTDRLLHLLFSGVFAFLAGFLIDRERKKQSELEKNCYLAGIGQVAASLVHDLRNPLISILGFVKRIREGKGDIIAATQVIENAAQNMQRIVDGVLDFARPIQLELKEEEIHRVIQQACDSCQIKAEERNVLLSMPLASDPVKIEMDSFNLQRAITNLINNAIEASPKGERVLLRTETEKNHVVVKVRDFGPGMDKETLENVFIPFYSKKSTGTGLGMTIAKKIIEEHQGKIRLESRPGAGTEAIIELPFGYHLRSKTVS